jgi:hypothetical protein
VSKSLQKQLSTARKRSFGVLAIFEHIVKELEAAASHSRQVAADAAAQATELNAISADATAHADEVEAKAAKLGDLIK